MAPLTQIPPVQLSYASYLSWIKEMSEFGEILYESVPASHLKKFFSMLHEMFMTHIPAEIIAAAGIFKLSEAIEVFCRPLPIDRRKYDPSKDQGYAIGKISVARRSFKKAFDDLDIAQNSLIPPEPEMIGQMISEIHFATEDALKAEHLTPQIRATLVLLEDIAYFASVYPHHQYRDLSSRTTTKLAAFFQSLLHIPVTLKLPEAGNRSERECLMEVCPSFFNPDES
jgi:hypothetical protein